MGDEEVGWTRGTQHKLWTGVGRQHMRHGREMGGASSKCSVDVDG